MACKDDVLVLLEKGLTPKQVADELGCRTEYVRATRARAFGNGRATCEKYRLRNLEKISAKKSDRYRNDPVFRERILTASAKRSERQKTRARQGSAGRLQTHLGGTN